MVRVAFAGASGTGKSTLATAVAEAFRLPLVPIGARSVAREMGFASPYDVDAGGRRGELQERLFAAKRAWEATAEAFVTDRTHLDNLAYTALHHAESLTAEVVDARLLASLRYDLIFFCSVEQFHDCAGDPARKPELGYHLAYELVLSSLLRSLANRGAFVFHVQSAELEARRAQVLETTRYFVSEAP